MPDYRLFGIRHHGPGSARSLVEALDDWQPDCLLIEGPEEAQAALDWIGHADLQPPVALLIYRPDFTHQAVYYPFARFSPEWQALCWARAERRPVRWMDLPQSIQLAAPAEAEGGVDPFALLATAGHDGERFWEDLVEHRRSGDVFAAVAELMTALRADAPAPGPRESRREAWMRQSLRQALADGFERIAVICGAWHVPALDPASASVKADKALLKGLPRVKTEVSWIPWTHSRLGWNSGYGAGIASPGWYAHLWAHPVDTGPRWLARAARQLRRQGLTVSSAHVIEAVRLSESLAALREKPRPGLDEYNEAILAVLTQGRQAPLQLLEQELIVGPELGRVPADLPAMPLQQNLAAELRRLRLKITAAEQRIKLDLRKELDRDKSALLHRLALLDLPWGQPLTDAGRKGSFREDWELEWQPEFSLRLIEAGVWGPTLAEAAAACTLHRAEQSRLEALIQLLDSVLLAQLPQTVPTLMQRLQNLAALTSDVLQLLRALPPLGRLLRYGSVRQFDDGLLHQMLDGLLARVCLGLPTSLRMLDDDTARQQLLPLGELHQMLYTLQEPDWLEVWLDSLDRLAGDERLPGVLAGYFGRLLFDLDRWPLAELERRLSRMISPGTPAEQAAAWIEGLLQGSGLMLLHHPSLLGLLDRWIAALTPETFLEALPLLRRSFARFENAERRQLGEQLRRQAQPAMSGPDLPEQFDLALARLTLPLLETLLGGEA